MKAACVAQTALGGQWISLWYPQLGNQKDCEASMDILRFRAVWGYVVTQFQSARKYTSILLCPAMFNV